MDTERGSVSTGSEGEGLDKPLRKQSSTSDAQFVNGKCKFCSHMVGIHMLNVDEIGYWSFCGISTCECFVDERAEDDS